MNSSRANRMDIDVTGFTGGGVCSHTTTSMRAKGGLASVGRMGRRDATLRRSELIQVAPIWNSGKQEERIIRSALKCLKI